MPTLRFVFTGICALTPGWPRSTSTPTTLTAVMPDSRRGRVASDDTTNIAAHAPFLFVPLANLGSGSRGADYVLTRTDTQECAVIFLDREELTTSPSPTNSLEYVIGEDPIGERPIPGNVTDIRWAADFREIDPLHAALKAGCVGSTTSVNPKVAARVRVDGGTVTSRFPCPEGASSTILNSPNTIHRQFAQEVVVEMEFASNVTEVVLETTLFDSGATPALDIVLQFIEAADIEVLFGNGPVESMLNLRDNDCAGHDHPGAIDYEFEIYYDVINFPAETPLPVPQTDEAELRHIDCFVMFVD
jgi:hypothetical protein